MSSSIPTQRDRLSLRNHLIILQTSEKLITAEILALRTGQYFRPLLQTAKLLKKIKKFRKSSTFSNYIRLPSIINLPLDNLGEGIAFLSVLQHWPVFETGWCTGQFMQTMDSQNQNKYDSTFWKIKKIFCFFYLSSVMQTMLPSLLSYPIHTIWMLHLTLLTNFILVAIFPTKEELASCFRIHSK